MPQRHDFGRRVHGIDRQMPEHVAHILVVGYEPGRPPIAVSTQHALPSTPAIHIARMAGRFGAGVSPTESSITAASSYPHTPAGW